MLCKLGNIFRNICVDYFVMVKQILLPWVNCVFYGEVFESYINVSVKNKIKKNWLKLLKFRWFQTLFRHFSDARILVESHFQTIQTSEFFWWSCDRIALKFEKGCNKIVLFYSEFDERKGCL